MKNKKSKIIVPALGLILLSTAASISGSVAWFTANRSVEVQANQFKVERLSGNLSCVMDTFGSNHATAFGITYVSDSQVTSGNMLNSSYNHSTSKIYYTEKDDGTGFEEEQGKENWKHTSANYYYAVKWKMTFSYQFGTDTTSQDLFFDTASVLDVVAGSGTSSKETNKAFRLRLEGEGGNLIWAKNQTSAKCTYIGGNPLANTAYVASDHLIASDVSAGNIATATPDSPVASASSKYNYLGTFTGSANATDEIVVTAIAWFEGSDENIKNDAKLDTVSATLKFFIHNQAS